MIKVKYSHIKEFPFLDVLGKLYHHPTQPTQKPFPARVAYTLAKISEKAEKEVELMRELWVKLLKQHATLDEKGEFVPKQSTDGKPVPGTFVVAEDKQAEFKKAGEEFGEIEINFTQHKLTFADLASISLTPQDIATLEPFLNIAELSAVAGKDAAVN